MSSVSLSSTQETSLTPEIENEVYLTPEITQQEETPNESEVEPPVEPSQLDDSEITEEVDLNSTETEKNKVEENKEDKQQKKDKLIETERLEVEEEEVEEGKTQTLDAQVHLDDSTTPTSSESPEPLILSPDLSPSQAPEPTVSESQPPRSPQEPDHDSSELSTPPPEIVLPPSPTSPLLVTKSPTSLRENRPPDILIPPTDSSSVSLMAYTPPPSPSSLPVEIFGIIVVGFNHQLGPVIGVSSSIPLVNHGSAEPADHYIGL
jgi:hypothetical protein